MISKQHQTDFRLVGQVVVITGAASGIGMATAKLFAEKGAVLCLLDRDAVAVEAVAGDIPNATGFYVDLGDGKTIGQAVEAVLALHGHIDVLVNSAGIGDIAWAEAMEEAIFRKVIDINLTGTFLMSQQVGRHMIAEKNGGKIISLASQAGLIAIDKHVAYSASKAGILSMTQSLAYEWGKYGIQVNAISPTATETPIIQGYWTEGKVHEDAIANTPAGRFCKPEEIAAGALFLASQASNMVTGANLVIDGGYTIH